MVKTYFRHQNFNNKGINRVTVAGFHFLPSNTLSIGISVCDEKDNFSRRIGRNISEGRARNKPIVYYELDVVCPNTEEVENFFIQEANELIDKYKDMKNIKF
jgi:hypothetical protein